MEDKPNVVFIDMVQTCYGRESLHYVPTAFLLRSYCIHQLHNHNDCFTFLQRQRHLPTTLYKTTLHLFHVRPKLNTSVVCLYQVRIVYMAGPAIKYKYFEFLTFSLVFQLLS